MAITLDTHAQQAIARRRRRGHNSAIVLRVAVIPARGTHAVLQADWATGRDQQHTMAVQQIGGVTLYVGRRIARYARWHDVTISGGRLGPFDYLTVAAEPRVMLELQRWERTHPGLLTAPAA